MQRILEPEVMDTPDEAASYDAMDNSAPNAAFLERLVELGAHGRMLDIGTGPGHIPLLACDVFPDATFVGVDLAEHMLTLANRHLADSRHTDRIEFRKSDAKGLEFDDASFDTVFSNTILHHIPDPRPFLAEARRVLRPGGVLLIRDLFRPPSEDDVARLVAEHAAYETDENRELFRASLCAAFEPDELRTIAREAGLGDARLVLDSDRHMSLQIAAAGLAE